MEATFLQGIPSYQVGSAELLADRNVKLKSGTITQPPEIEYCGAGEMGLGITQGNGKLADAVSVRPYTMPGEVILTMSSNCSIGSDLYASANGKFSTTPNGTVMYKAVQANASGDGSKVTAILHPTLATVAGSVTYDNAGGETLESDLQGVGEEIYGHIQSASKFIALPLSGFRILSAGLIAAAGSDLPASDTDPAFENIADGDAARIKWAAASVVEIQTDVLLPPHLDPAVDVVLHALCGKDADVDTVHFDGEVRQGEGDSDFFPAAGASNLITQAKSEITATFPNADISGAAVSRNLTLILKPEAHANDIVYLYGAWLEFTGQTLS